MGDQRPKRGDSLAERVATVRNLKVRGMSNQDILEYGQKTWDVDERTVYGYLTTARLQIKQEYADLGDREEMLAQITARYTKIATLAMADKKYTAAVAATRELANLAGLNVQRVEVSGSVSFVKSVDLTGWTPQQVELLARALGLQEEPMEALPAHEEDAHGH